MTEKNRQIRFFIITFLYTCFALIVSSIAKGYRWEIVNDYFGGPINHGIYPQQVIEWLLISTPVYGVEGWWINSIFTMADMTVYRYGNVCNWWRKNLVGIYSIHVWYYVLLIFVLRCHLEKYWNMEIYKVIICIFLHSMLMITGMIFLRILSHYILMPFTIVVIIEVCNVCLVRYKWFQPKWWPFIWGMNNADKKIYGIGGFDLKEVIIWTVVIIVIVLWIPFWKKRLLLRSLSHEKDRINKCE